jgi:hypothetical protein
MCVRFVVFTAVTTKNSVFWYVAVTAAVVSSALIHSNLTMEDTSSSKTSILARATMRDIPEDGNLQHKY